MTLPPGKNFGPHARASSPRPGCSTFTTSAPSPPRISVQVGPASDEVRSTTRIPCSGSKLTRSRLPIGSHAKTRARGAAKRGGEMKLGMNMLLWSTDVTGPEYLPVFEQLRDLGYDGIEVPIFDTSPTAVAGYEQLGEQLAGLGLEALGVGARSAEDSPISTDPAVRARGLQATNAAVDICAALGSRIICGPLGAPLGHFTGPGP